MAKSRNRRFNDSKIPTERTIKTKAWRKYTDSLRLLSDKASGDLEKYIRAGHTEKETLEVAHALVTKYGEASSELACQMYEALAEYSGAAVAAAEAAATATYGETARAIRGEMLRTRDAKTISSAAGRLVKLASVDTMTKNALRDGAEWAWIPSGDTCPYCLMLASKGWQRASDKIIKNGHATHIHNNCDCTFAVRLSDDVDVEGYDPDALYDEYINAGDTQWERINTLRRRKYAENRDFINAQKRAAYARRKLGNILSGLERPDINSFPERIPVNTDGEVEAILKKMDFEKSDKELVEYIKHSVQQIPKEEFSILDNYGIQVNRSGENVFISEPVEHVSGKLVYEIRINPESSLEYGFAHEYVHFAVEVNNLSRDEDFVAVVSNFADSIQETKGAAIKGTSDVHSVVISPLTVDVYQGRTYVEFGAYEPVRDISIGDLVEYVPTGYEYFLGDPEILEKTDPTLYNYFIKRGLR